MHDTGAGVIDEKGEGEDDRRRSLERSERCRPRRPWNPRRPRPTGEEALPRILVLSSPCSVSPSFLFTRPRNYIYPKRIRFFSPCAFTPSAPPPFPKSAQLKMQSTLHRDSTRIKLIPFDDSRFVSSRCCSIFYVDRHHKFLASFAMSALSANSSEICSFFLFSILENLDWAEKENLINCGYEWPLITSYLRKTMVIAWCILE